MVLIIFQFKLVHVPIIINKTDSVSISDHQNKPYVLTEVIGYEMTSEHITIRSEESVHNYQDKSGASKQTIYNYSYLITILFLAHLLSINHVFK